MMDLTISMARHPLQYQPVELWLSDTPDDQVLSLNDLGAHAERSAELTVRGLLALHANGGTIDTRTVMLAEDHVKYLHDLITDAKKKTSNIGWWAPLFVSHSISEVRDSKWSVLLAKTSGGGNYRIDLKPGWKINVIVDGDPTHALDDVEVHRFVSGGSISLEHLQSRYVALVDEIKRLRKKADASFWPWLAGEVLHDCARAVEAAQPPRTTRGGVNQYLTLIADGIDQVALRGWVLALCGFKPFETPPYYDQFLDIASKRDGVCICRIFLEPADGFDTATLATIAKHDEACNVLPIVVPKERRDDVEKAFLGIADALDQGFGFVMFCAEGNIWAVTHEGRTVQEFAHSRLLPPLNVSPLVRLFEGLCRMSTGWKVEETRQSLRTLIDPVKQSLWMKELGAHE